MRYVFQYPDVHGTDADLLDAGPITDLAVAAEASGWDGFAFTEHPAPSARWLEAGGHQSLDPFVALAHVGAVTSRLELLTYVTVLPYRNPSLLAKSAATVDKLSGGRLVLGAGTGYLKSEYFALGVDFDERNALFDEALDVLALHWSGQPFDYDGRHFSCRGTIGRPLPVRQPIPVWIGGNSTLTLRRVAERAQGWMPLVGSPSLAATTRSPQISTIDDLASRIAVLRDLAGERFSELTIAVAYHGDGIHEPSLDTDRHREAIGALGELGVTCLVVPGPSAPHPRALEFVHAFAATVIS